MQEERQGEMALVSGSRVGGDSLSVGGWPGGRSGTTKRLATRKETLQMRGSGQDHEQATGGTPWCLPHKAAVRWVPVTCVACDGGTVVSL